MKLFGNIFISLYRFRGLNRLMCLFGILSLKFCMVGNVIEEDIMGFLYVILSNEEVLKGFR